MTTINNATGLYAKLGYNFNDPNNMVQILSANVQSELANTPAIMSEMTARSIINGDTTEYFKNPVEYSVQSISNSANSIMSICTNLNGNIPQTSGLPSLVTTCQNYIKHTNNISGITNANSTTHQDGATYKTALSIGKMMLYVTNQTDGIINTSPILGNFTSLFVGPQLSEYANTLISYVSLINDSVTTNTVNGIRTSNLTTIQANTITNYTTTTNTFLTTRQTHDQTFFENSKNIVISHTNVDFGSFGEIEKYLINNFIGTPELINIINT